MADFSATLRNTLAKLDNPSDELRQKVYGKAREAIQRKIDALPAKPSQAAIDRQFAKLDDAIADVETDYKEPEIAEIAAEPVEEPQIEELAEQNPVDEPVVEPEPVIEAAPEADMPTAVESGGSRIAEIKARAKANAKRMEEEAAAATQQAEAAAQTAMPAVESDDPLKAFLEETSAPAVDASGGIDAAQDELDAALNSLTSQSDAADRALSGMPVIEDSPAPEPITAESADMYDAPSAKSRKGLAYSLLFLLLAGGGAAYAWVQHEDQVRETLSGFGIELPASLSMDSGDDVTPEEAPSSDTEEPADEAAASDDGLPVRTVPSTVITPEAQSSDEPSEQGAAPAAETSGSDVASATEGSDVQKFTQRLTENGAEVDDGPLGGEPDQTEGSSVAAQTEEGSEPLAPEADNGGASDTEAAAAEQPAAVPLPVGQRAVFYEERTGSQAGTTFPGATIWTVVQEAPASGIAPEPAIRAEASVPDLGLVMEMTIKRNGDETLPASHLMEVFFRVPDTFEGRGITDLQRVSMKNNESDPGNALVAVPAPLDTNIFIIALNGADTARNANVQLLEEREWFDIPIQYVTGRRALVTMEKGTAGRSVFEEVLTYWQNNPLGAGG